MEFAKYPFRQVFYNQFFTPLGPSPGRLKNWSINTCLQWYFALPARCWLGQIAIGSFVRRNQDELLLSISCNWWSKSCNKAMVRTPWQGQGAAHLSRCKLCGWNFENVFFFGSLIWVLLNRAFSLDQSPPLSLDHLLLGSFANTAHRKFKKQKIHCCASNCQFFALPTLRLSLLSWNMWFWLLRGGFVVGMSSFSHFRISW